MQHGRFTSKARIASLVAGLALGVGLLAGDSGPVAADSALASTACKTARSVAEGYQARLVGTNASDCLRGGKRRDRIRGLRGRDLLNGSAGRDRINARDGARDKVNCGSGKDVVLADSKDVLSGCENKRVGEEVTPPPGGNTGDCAVDPATLTAPGCRMLKSDTGEVADPEQLWGNIECASDNREERPTTGGDTHVGATGEPTTDGFFRRLTVLDGDDFYGERCELGRNEHRYGAEGGDGTFMTYNEGDRRITFLSVRAQQSLPIGTKNWQTIAQMKQAQPSANGGGGPMIEVQLRNGAFHLDNPSDTHFSAPATTGVWTRIALDVYYSSDASVGSVVMYVDTNGDGDAADEGEQSPVVNIPTIKREIAGGWEGDGIAAGEPIPSHLRAGVYHDPVIPCVTGCSIDLDNVQVVG